MDPTKFDELTKALATSTSRRQALKAIAATTLGSILGLGGIGTTFGAPKCHRAGLGCDTDSNCCSQVCCNGKCCASGQVCQNGTCVTCAANGAHCSQNTDCCSGNCTGDPAAGNGFCCPSGYSNCGPPAWHCCPPGVGCCFNPLGFCCSTDVCDAGCL